MSVGSDGRIGEALNPPAGAGVPEATSLQEGGLPVSPTLLPASRDTDNILAQALGVGSSQSFMIDFEHAPQSIVDLKAAAEFLKTRADVARGLANIPSPGMDGVSLNAVEVIGKWATDSGTNNLEATLRAGAMQLENLAQKLSEDLQTYLQVDKLDLPSEASRGLP